GVPRRARLTSRKSSTSSTSWFNRLRRPPAWSPDRTQIRPFSGRLGREERLKQLVPDEAAVDERKQVSEQLNEQFHGHPHEARSDAKRSDTSSPPSIGHKGMGFKSVLEITDAPEVFSTTVW